jgi:hypothetical protein
LSASMMTMGMSWWFIKNIKKIFHTTRTQQYLEENIHEWLHYITSPSDNLKSWFSTVSLEKTTPNWEIYRENYFEF